MIKLTFLHEIAFKKSCPGFKQAPSMCQVHKKSNDLFYMHFIYNNKQIGGEIGGFFRTINCVFRTIVFNETLSLTTIPCSKK